MMLSGFAKVPGKAHSEAFLLILPPCRDVLLRRLFVYGSPLRISSIS